MKRPVINPPDSRVSVSTSGSESPSVGVGDRIELMQTFVRIVEAGNLSAAAVQLGTTQPTVSRRLKSLERFLGVTLLQRSTHSMRLTLDGERCYEHARELLTSWAAMTANLQGVREEPEGVLKVVVPHAFGQHRLVAPLAEYLRRYPRVAVEWLLHDDTAVEDFVARGVDCAIQVGEMADSALVAVKLAEVPRIVVAAPALLKGGPAPRQVSDLADLPWLALGTYYRNEVSLRHEETGDVQRISIVPRLTTDSLYALKSATLEGLGVSIGSAWLQQADLAAGRLVRLMPQWAAAPLPVSLVYPYAGFYPARLRCFIEIMKTALPAMV